MKKNESMKRIDLIKAEPGECERAVKDAVDAGYRHFDTAFLYGTENEVGNGIRSKIAEGVIRREDVFVVTKVKRELNLKFRREYHSFQMTF